MFDSQPAGKPGRTTIAGRLLRLAGDSTMYAIIHDQSALESALRLARGCYQRAILTGSEAISGATLRGRAKQYAGRYADSARAILRRCQSAGLPVREERGPHGKRLVVIGHATVAAAWECIPADVAERELCAA